MGGLTHQRYALRRVGPPLGGQLADALWTSGVANDKNYIPDTFDLPVIEQGLRDLLRRAGREEAAGDLELSVDYVIGSTVGWQVRRGLVWFDLVWPLTREVWFRVA